MGAAHDSSPHPISDSAGFDACQALSTFLWEQALRRRKMVNPGAFSADLTDACNFSEQLRVIAYLQNKDCSRGQWQH